MSIKHIETSESNTEAVESTSEPSQQAKKKPHKYGVARRVIRGVVWGTICSIALTVVVLASILTWLDSDHGRARLVEVINRSGVVTLKSLQGSFWSRLEVKDLRVDTTDVEVKLNYGVLGWTPYSVFVRKLYLNELSLDVLQIKLKPQPPMKEVSPPPTQLTLPFSLRVIQLKIAQLDISDAPLLKDIQASLDSDGESHRLSVQQIRAPQGTLSAALNLNGIAPFATAGSFVLAGELEKRTLTAVGHVVGDLRALAVKADLTAEQVTANVDVKLDVFAPHAYQIVQHGHARLNQINPAAFHPSAPKARINADLDVKPTADGASIKLSLQNQVLDSLDRQGLPLRSLNAQLQLKGEALEIQSLLAQLSGNGRVTANGRIFNEQLDLKVGLQGIDPALLWSPQPASQMAGSLAIKGPWLAPDVKGQLSDARFKAVASIDMGWIRPDQQRRIAVRRLELSRAGSQVLASGEVNLLSPFDFKLNAELQRFNPADYFSVPAGRIGGNFVANGRVEPRLLVDLNYNLRDSQFNGESLTGQGQLKLTDNQLQDSQLWLALGANRVDVKGALGQVNDKLSYQLHLPNLAVIGKGFSGLVDGQGVLSGPLNALQIQGDLKVQQLKTPWDMSIKQADIHADVPSDLQRPLKVQLNLTELRLAETVIDKVNLLATGTRSSHELTLSASGQHQKQALLLNTVLQGSLNDAFLWQGKIKNFDGKAFVPFQLMSPMALTVSAEQFQLGAGELNLGQSSVKINNVEWHQGIINTSGELKRIVLADWLPLMGNKDIKTDLVLAGGWSLKQDHAINGQLNIKRISGDVGLQSNGTASQAFQMSELQLAAKITNNQLNIQSSMKAPRLGIADFNLSALLDPHTLQVAENSALTMGLRSDLPDLSLLSPFMGPSIQLAGNAKISVQRVAQSGVVSMTGGVQGSGLALRDASTGIRMTDGQLDIALSNQQIQLRTLRFKGGKGELTGSGVIELGDAGLVGSAKLKANQFTLISKPDMLLVMSGQGAIEFRDGTLQINGQFVADEGDIQFVSNEVPRLSSDVVVLGRERKETSRTLPMNVEVAVDLGNNFRFRGYGLDAELIGQLRLRAQASQPLRANGTVSVDKGTFRAYGRTLDIERGVLSFIGPLDNPGLDVLAIRRNQAVEAGVRVQGSAQSPRVTLFSEPNVPDSEKLSWLLFGHGVENVGGADGALLLQLLNSMATGDATGPGVTGNMLSAVGLDDAGYSSVKEADGSTTQVVSVTKQLARNLSVSLEKSFNGLRDAVSFSLQLSRNWSIVSRIGVDSSSVNINWTRQFD
ncbi:translocation/assembly module TamB domain-containing protein [Deefgea tanakiae]|uniref:Translocation/assembly module TamB domain-containing protein n=1 Tax=Deefgea tanakiae TaxID=2865840 RepID=A0ABX8Z8E6_9NEIS|nr:translocation/assembly module TamB domain-containing protein [Deefgea tanakiae]QZA78861.1 translocation/assembly module TamB domain-containing protein [Deefgea tanakiae]